MNGKKINMRGVGGIMSYLDRKGMDNNQKKCLTILGQLRLI